MKVLRRFLIPGIAAVLATSIAIPALANEGNPEPSDVGYPSANYYSFKIEPINPGTFNYTQGGLSITVTFYEYQDNPVALMDWESNLGIDAIIVKAGNGYELYTYDEATSDDGLHGTINPTNGKYPDISHVWIIWDAELQVTKTATTTFTRTWDWTIVKTASPTEIVDLDQGESTTVDYTIDVTATSVDSDWAVSGTITVYNPAPDATTVSVTDVVSPNITATVSDGGSAAVGGNSTVIFTYSAALPDGSDRTNTATATSSVAKIGNSSGTAAVTFGAPTTETDEAAIVSDLFDELAGFTVSVDDAGPWTVTGTRTITFTATVTNVSAGEGEHTLVNTATLVTNDTETEFSDDAEVVITVPEGEGDDDEEPGDGEGLSPGFWKNHPDAWEGYTTGQTLGSVFTFPTGLASLGDKTFLEALNFGGSGEFGSAQTLLRQAVAALLNAAYFDDYGMSAQEIIDAVNDALESGDTGDLQDDLDEGNNQGGEVEDPGPATPTPGNEKDNPGKGKGLNK